MLWEILADSVLVLHAGYVAFVIFGFAAILLGVVMGWQWVRNFTFRLLHLLAILFVCAEALTGEACPLTLLENDFRQRAGQYAYRGDFIAYWLHRIIFYNWPPWVFTVLYVAFGALVLAVFVLAPPRWSSKTHGREQVRRS